MDGAKKGRRKVANEIAPNRLLFVVPKVLLAEHPLGQGVEEEDAAVQTTTQTLQRLPDRRRRLK